MFRVGENRECFSYRGLSENMRTPLPIFSLGARNMGRGVRIFCARKLWITFVKYEPSLPAGILLLRFLRPRILRAGVAARTGVL